MVFLVVLFLIKNTSLFKNTISFVQNKQENGLTYDDNATIEDLVNKDIDGDGIPDWQESLYGLDPTKQETTPGIPDNTVINKLRIQQGASADIVYGKNSSVGTENLTQTEKFSRELFATVVALNQNGQADQATIEALSASLSEKIKNPIVRKIYLISDIKIINDDSSKAFENYTNALISIDKKYPVKTKEVMNVLQLFLSDKNNLDINALIKLDPIIKQERSAMIEILKMNIPKFIAPLHLDFLNATERVLENLSDIKLFESDPLVALGAISNFEQNIIFLESAGSKLIKNN